MALLRLPAELLLHVAEHLPAAALPALARTAAHLAPIAQRVLFRHLAVAPCYRNLRLVPLLARTPRLARHVRSLHVALDPAAPILRSFYGLLADALRNMPDLHALRLHIDASATAVLRAAAHPSLVSFTSTFPLDHDVIRFLERTPSLLELELDSIPTVPALPALPDTAIPHLEQFTGSSRVASLIVPGRPVNSIHLSGSSLSESDVPLLARSAAPVLFLAAVTTASPVAFLQLLHRHLPHLVYLRVMSTQNLFQPPSAQFYEQVADALALFPELTAFELSGMHWGSHPKRDDESKRVWQSSPISSTPLPIDDHDLFLGSDFLLAY